VEDKSAAGDEGVRSRWGGLRVGSEIESSSDGGAELKDVFLREDEGDRRVGRDSAVDEGTSVTFDALSVLFRRRERESDAKFAEFEDEMFEDRFGVGMEVEDGVASGDEGCDDVAVDSSKDLSG
jgi:hypothetical protein